MVKSEFLISRKNFTQFYRFFLYENENLSAGRVVILFVLTSLLWQVKQLNVPRHTGLTKVCSIWFLIFEIKRILVFNSIIIYFTDLFI